MLVNNLKIPYLKLKLDVCLENLNKVQFIPTKDTIAIKKHKQY